MGGQLKGWWGTGTGVQVAEEQIPGWRWNKDLKNGILRTMTVVGTRGGGGGVGWTGTK